MAKLSTNHYGKGSVRLVKVSRGETVDELKDMTVGIGLEADYTAAYLEGDNRLILPTDTMKNTVYALAAQHPVQSPELFARLLVDHFVDNNPQPTIARVDIMERVWRRLKLTGHDVVNSFLREAGGEKRLASVHRDGDTVSIQGGLDDLRILRTGDTAFAEFFEDPYTTLPETHDRVLQTKIKATWLYARHDADFDAIYKGARDILLRVFATHHSLSVQHTLFSMGEAVLEAFPDIAEIELDLPNVHCLAVDLTRFGLENKSEGQTEIFLAVDEPFGSIHAKIVRD